jgi:hypothetical protein
MAGRYVSRPPISDGHELEAKIADEAIKRVIREFNAALPRPCAVWPAPKIGVRVQH